VSPTPPNPFYLQHKQPAEEGGDGGSQRFCDCLPEARGPRPADIAEGVA
jgi:hypothetical protein